MFSEVVWGALKGGARCGDGVGRISVQEEIRWIGRIVCAERRAFRLRASLPVAALAWDATPEGSLPEF